MAAPDSTLERPPTAFASSPQAAAGSPMSVHALRLRPGQDLLNELCAYAAAANLQAAFIVTCVGSLTTAALRFANKPGPAKLTGHFEICSLVGTLSRDSCHLHISIADGDGNMRGGHVLEGCVIYTTAEIVLGEATALTFSRPVDPETTWDELAIETRDGTPG
jgi:predicted DNA-binding protein with PD1-like motif